jgi:hypothetical protein
VAATKAVYIVCDWPGRIRYVGSTVRGADSRVLEHLADIDRTLAWATVWIVQLREELRSAKYAGSRDSSVGRFDRPTTGPFPVPGRTRPAPNVGHDLTDICRRLLTG